MSLQEIAQHRKKNNAWIVIGDLVYDVTKFLNDHPGGANVLMVCNFFNIIFVCFCCWRMCTAQVTLHACINCTSLQNVAGRDATHEFEDAGHSSTAREMMKEFLIAKVDRSQQQQALSTSELRSGKIFVA